MTAVATRAVSRDFAPAAVGAGTLVASLLLMEILIRSDVISRFIVPPPSEIGASFWRVIVDEHVFKRFLVTAAECLTAGVMITVFAVAGSVLMHLYRLLQQACETWDSALAASAVVLAYPLLMVIICRYSWTIIMMRFPAARSPVNL